MSTPRPLFTPGKDLELIVQEAGWAPGPVWTGAENLAPTGIRSPERPARSQSLYRLSYPAIKKTRCDVRKVSDGHTQFVLVWKKILFVRLVEDEHCFVLCLYPFVFAIF